MTENKSQPKIAENNLMVQYYFIFLILMDSTHFF